MASLHNPSCLCLWCLLRGECVINWGKVNAKATSTPHHIANRDCDAINCVGLTFTNSPAHFIIAYETRNPEIRMLESCVLTHISHLNGKSRTRRNRKLPIFLLLAHVVISQEQMNVRLSLTCNLALRLREKGKNHETFSIDFRREMEENVFFAFRKLQ